MTTSPFNTDRRLPQLIPHRLLRDRQIHHPAVLDEAKRRSDKFHLRLADHITAFAGSMNFVLIHVVLFAVWIALLESYPWPILALLVSLEAIFLSTFVMIGQNRQAAFQQAKADHDYEAQELELKTNTNLTRPNPAPHSGIAPALHRWIGLKSIGPWAANGPLLRELDERWNHQTYLPPFSRLVDLSSETMAYG